MRNVFHLLKFNNRYKIKVKISFFLFCLFATLFINIRIQAQNCLPGGITFTTQSSIDNFATNYPGCTFITGSVIINGSGISNLNGLSQITHIGETYPNGLYILNTSLVNLQGLNNLAAVDGAIKIENNAMLVNLAGLESLTQLTNALEIHNNSGLTSLQGLNNITKAGYYIKITNNASLLNLTGLNSLETIGYDVVNNYCSPSAYLTIKSNANLMNMQALQNLEKVCGSLYVESNPLLQDIYLPSLQLVGNELGIGWNNSITHLNFLNSLTHIHNSITIRYNTNLTSIAGLSSVIYFDIYSDIHIIGNKLSNLNGLGWLQNLYSLIIEDEDQIINLQGLSNLNQVGGNFGITGCNLLQNLSGISTLTAVGNLYLDSNPQLTSLSGLQNLTTIYLHFYFKRNHQVPNFQGLNNITSIGGFFQVLENNGLTSLSGLNGVSAIGGFVDIYSNPVLANLSGLNQLTTVGGQLRIAFNPMLLNLGALSNLTSINGKLEITSNGNITTLNGLDQINHMTITNLVLQNNPMLSYCELLNICNYLAFLPAKPRTISNNAAPCATVAAVNDACDAILPVKNKMFLVEKSGINNTLLTWTTSTEVNNKGWNIQRSANGIKWENIGWTDGSGNTQMEKSYTFTDPRPMNGLNYYKLQQIDFDGKSSYSEVKYLEFRAVEISVYPNPVIDKLYIRGMEDGNPFTITDMNGRNIMQGKITKEYIDVSGLAAGSYILSIHSGGKVHHHRVVKVE